MHRINDSNRQGFEINVPRNSNNPRCDPVESLQFCIARTDKFISDCCNALFLTLCALLQAVSADTIGNIFKESIRLAGLHRFTARAFKPTGVTIAVIMGMLSETVMKIGRWKTQDVYLNH